MATGDYQHADGVYEFGDFRLHASQRRLTARTDGRPIELTQKAFDALSYLVQHPGQLLDKSTLIAAVWPNIVVEENNLNQVVSALRRALGDGSGGQRFIVTVPGRGYQFVASVCEVLEDTEQLAFVFQSPDVIGLYRSPASVHCTLVSIRRRHRDRVFRALTDAKIPRDQVALNPHRNSYRLLLEIS